MILRHLLGQARRLVGVRLHLVDGNVHLVHARAGFLGGEREGVDVLRDFLDGIGHLLDRGDGLAHAAGELDDVLRDRLVGRGHLHDGRPRLLGARREHLDVLADGAQGLGGLAHVAADLLAGGHLRAHALGELAQRVEQALRRLRQRFTSARAGGDGVRVRVGDLRERVVHSSKLRRRTLRRARTLALEHLTRRRVQALHRAARSAARARVGDGTDAHERDEAHEHQAALLEAAERRAHDERGEDGNDPQDLTRCEAIHGNSARGKTPRRTEIVLSPSPGSQVSCSSVSRGGGFPAQNRTPF
jgi:hypothetical protein